MNFRDELKQAIGTALKELFAIDQETANLLERPRDESHGDYASSIALKLSKQLQKNPREIAQQIADHIGKLDNFLLPEIAGPGFINFKISDPSLLEFIIELDKTDHKNFLSIKPGAAPVIWEYSAPNIAKPLGVHHLLSTITGQALANIYRYIGYNVVAINYIGDWGTQFGKLIYALKTWGDKDVIGQNPIEELLKLYVKFHEEAEKDPTLTDEGRKELKKLEDGDAENTKLFTEIVELSLQGLTKTYDLLGGVSFDLIRGESPVVKLAQQIVEEHLKNGNLKLGEEGAVIAEFPVEDMPTTVIRRGDGATVYLTRDLATIKERVEKWAPQKIFYVVDVAQRLHFKQLFALAKRMDLLPADGSSEGVHISFGRMKFTDQNMSTRKGNILRLDDVLKESISRSEVILKEKNVDVNEEEFNSLAKTIGVGGVKYSILSQNRETDIVFDWDKILTFEGNSAAYLQYVYARAQKVVKLSGESASFNVETLNLEDADRNLCRTLLKFPEILELAAKENKPHFIADFLFQLGQAYNSFYAQSQILKAEENTKNFRVKLCQQTAKTIKLGLELLSGIEVAERM